MKKLLLILFCLPIIGFGQQTYVPDDNFEAYLEANGMGNGIPNDDYVTTSSIDTAAGLYVSNQNISDLTGIEDFISIANLQCNNNQLAILNLSNNTALSYLECWNNQLTDLDFSQNIWLDFLFCQNNQITTINLSSNIVYSFKCNNNPLQALDLSNNINLTDLYCYGNTSLLTLDLSHNQLLKHIECADTYLTSIDVRNGTNSLLNYFDLQNNPFLSCINVDDSLFCSNNWNSPNHHFDTHHYFSENCYGTTSIQEHTTNKELLQTTGLLGKEKKGTKNEVLFYIYDDGTVEKRIAIE